MIDLDNTNKEVRNEILDKVCNWYSIDESAEIVDSKVITKSGIVFVQCSQKIWWHNNIKTMCDPKKKLALDFSYVGLGELYFIQASNKEIEK